MSKVGKIIRSEINTYSKSDGAGSSRYYIYILLNAIISAVFIIFFTNLTMFTLSGLLAAFSILTGFTLNAALNLVGSSVNISDIGSDGVNASVEAKMRSARLSKFRKELFSNTTYLALSALTSVFLIVLLVVSSNVTESIAGNLMPKENEAFHKFLCFSNVLRVAITYLLYFFMLVSLTTFARTIFRLFNFYERRIAHGF